MAASPPPLKTASAQKPNSTSPIHTKLFPKNPNPAFHAVFDTMELAEMILGELCMRDLLISAQRVCKDWKSTIDSSHRLQEALFFRPINDKRLVYRGRSPKEHRAMMMESEINGSTVVEWASPIFEHPIITSKYPWVGRLKSNWFHRPDEETMGCPEASWRRQLMTQPPLAELGCWTFGIYRPMGGRVVRAKSTVGLTLGDYATEFGIRNSHDHEIWSWQEIKWEFAPAVSMIEPARFATYTEGQWVAE